MRNTGDRAFYNSHLKNAVVAAETLTANNTSLNLNIAINYSGRWDILQAMQKLSSCQDLSQLELAFTSNLMLGHTPNPDLLIRTGGVQRLSNFMLWDLAYTELSFTRTLWPDFKPEELQAMLANFTTIERRFGQTSAQLQAAVC